MKKCVLVLAALCWLSAGMRATASDWPQYRGPNRNGSTSESDWKPWTGTATTEWKTNVGKGYSSVVVAGNHVYTMGHVDEEANDVVRCVTADRGLPVWKYPYRCSTSRGWPGPRSTPAVDSGRVYTLSRFGHLFCLTANKGEVVWKKNLETDYRLKAGNFGVVFSLIVDGDNLIVMMNSYFVIAFNKVNGQEVWKWQGKYGQGFASPVIMTQGERKTVLIFSTAGLNCLTSDGGKPLWHYPAKSDGFNTTDPLVSGSQVFVQSPGVQVLELGSGEPVKVWENKGKKGRNNCNGAVLHEGYVYGVSGGCRGGNLNCVKLSTGELMWTSKESLNPTTLILAGDKLVFLKREGNLVIAEASHTAYKEVARDKVIDGPCWTLPAFSGGRIFCRNDKGDLVCVNVQQDEGDAGKE